MNSFPQEKNGFFGVILCIALAIGLSMAAACGGGSSASIGPPQSLAITIEGAIPLGNVGTAYPGVGFQETGGTQPFTWSASGGPPPGLTFLFQSGGECGTGCAIQGTPTAHGTFTFTVTVTDGVGASASKMLSITIGPPLPLNITTTSSNLPDGTVNSAYAFPLQAAGGVPPFTWSMASGSSLPSGLALDSSGNISGKPTTFGNFDFTVQASDSETPPQSATANLSLLIHTLLFGQYSFLFQGFDANGAVLAAGSFNADGLGNIANGIEDINRHVAGPTTNVKFTGSYAMGPDNRGTLTFTSSLGPSTFAFATDGSRATFIEFDSTGTRGSGEIKSGVGDCTPFADNSGATFAYAFGISGDDVNNGRVALAGSFQADAAGNLTGGFLDENDASKLSSDVAWTGTYAAPASSTRCTVTLTPAGLPARNFAYYPFSSNSNRNGMSGGFLLGVDAVASAIPLTGGAVLRVVPSGNAPVLFSNASLNTPLVGGLTGFSVGAGAPDVSLVFFSPNGSGTAIVTLDENKGGLVTMGTVVKGTYDVSSNGRVTLTAGTNPPVLYLASATEAFAVGTDDAAMLGVLESIGPLGSTSLNNGTINGTFLLRTDAPASAKVPDFSGGVSFDGTSALTGTSDESAPSANTGNQAFKGTYSVTNAPADGQGTFTITPTGGPPANFIFHTFVEAFCSKRRLDGGCMAVSVIASKVVAIPSDATQTNPAVLTFELQ